MAGSHGDLFQEIGKLVLAAHAGQSIDLAAKSEELAERYVGLGMPAELMAKAIARSLGAVGISMAIVANGHHKPDPHHANRANGNGANGNGLNGNGLNGNGHANGHAGEGAITLSNGGDADEAIDVAQPTESQAKAASSALFPSGLRLSVLN